MFRLAMLSVLLGGASALRVPLATPRQAHLVVARVFASEAFEGEPAMEDDGESVDVEAPAAIPEPMPVASSEAKKDLKDFAAPAAAALVLLGGAFAFTRGGDTPAPTAAPTAVVQKSVQIAPDLERSMPAPVEAPAPPKTNSGYQEIPDVWKMK